MLCHCKSFPTYEWCCPTSDHGEPPHGGELVAARGVSDLQDHVPVTALDHLPAHTIIIIIIIIIIILLSTHLYVSSVVAT